MADGPPQPPQPPQPAPQDPTTPEPVKVRRGKYLKHALLLSYCGAGYFGLQRNPPHPTIEEELLKALKATDVINDAEFEKPQHLYFQRAARTDKGVSAAKQILSMKLPNNFHSKIPAINEQLPSQIKVISAVRTTKFFDSKNYCDARTYSYMMPSYSLCGPDEITSESYRTTSDRIAEFNKILSYYGGTHNYHNFTSQKEAHDASAQRYIISIECGQPFLRQDIEFVVIRIKGQSFMLHQIRKMIGLAIAIMRGFATVETLKQCFSPVRIDIPKAPGLGLMLEEVHYDKYNKRFGGDGVHEPLLWTEHSNVINTFKDEYIYPIMINTEKNEHSMMKWLDTLALHTYSERKQCENEYEAAKQISRRPAIFGAAYKVGLIKDSVSNSNEKQEEEEEGSDTDQPTGEHDDDNGEFNNEEDEDGAEQDGVIVKKARVE